MTALVAWLWQGAAIALTTAAMLGMMRRLNAATRHAIWWCALGSVLGVPFVAMALSGSTEPAAAAVPPLAPRVFVLPAPPDWLIAAAIGAWLGTVIVGLVKIMAGLRSLARLKAESRPLDPARESRLAMWSSTPFRGRRPELRVSEGARAACALGLWRPVILLSEALVEVLDDDALDQVVMHEHAHLVRHDDWLRLLESSIVSVTGLHPAVRFIARQIDLEREAACDDAVVSRSGGAYRYAACLADAAAIAARGRRAAGQLVPSATGSTVSLRSRVVRLLDPQRARGAQLAPLAIAAGVLALACTVGFSHQLAPILIFGDTSAVNRPAVMPARMALSAVAPRPAPGAAFDRPLIASARSVNGRPSVGRRPNLGDAQAQVAPQLTPAEVLGRMPASEADASPIPLASSSISAGVHAPVPIASGVVRPASDTGNDAGVKWSSLGAPGVAIGRGAKSLAGFFGGTAKAVAASF